MRLIFQITTFILKSTNYPTLQDIIFSPKRERTFALSIHTRSPREAISHLQGTVIKASERNRARIAVSVVNGNALKKHTHTYKRREKTEKNGFRTRKDTELFRARLFSVREPADSQGHRTPGLLSRKGKRRREKKGKDTRKMAGRDANIFASRRSQRGESVQKVSLRQRQVITRIRTKAEFKVEVNYLAGI